MSGYEDLIQLSASEVLRLLERGEITPCDTLDALHARINQVEGQVNALPTLCFERARDHALRLQETNPAERGLLRGLPVAIKDLTTVAGVRTTFGSKLYENFVPETSDILVENLEANGGVVYAKSNTPEFGAGGNSFNEVFATTRNPHNLERSAGGSSGGAAAALASGTAWLAHGSDNAGSLRTPASFCGVTSLRPSPGLFASGPKPLPFEVMPLQGPMARTIEDLALFTDAMVGDSSLSGLSKSVPEDNFVNAARRPERPLRIAFSPDLGITETSAEVVEVCTAALRKIESSGITIDTGCPDLTDAHDAFSVHRSLDYAIWLGDRLEETRQLIKPEVVWEIEQGLAFDGATIRGAMAAQGRVFANAAVFMQDYDLLVCPASIVPAIPLEERYLGYGNGVELPDYYRWLAIGYAITVTSLPVITIPCGKTADKLPVGIQLIGKAHGEHKLFSYARYLEQVLDWDSSPVTPG